MAFHKVLSVSVLCLMLGLTGELFAQGPGGDSGGFGGRMLRRLDRNEDGVLDPDELDQSGPLKDYLARHDVDVSRPVPLGVAADLQAGMFQEMRERGEFPGGFGGPPGGGGGPPGGFGGGPPGGDEGRGSEGGRSRRRGEGGSNSGTPEGRSGRGGGRTESGGPPRGPGMPAGKSDPKSKVRVGRVGPKANLPPATLPAQYASRDINQDGQIGMYEWSRTDLSTFRNLDRNGDGFLVPAELASPAPPGGTTTASTTTAPNSAQMNISQSSGGGNSTRMTTAQPAKPNEPPADLKTVAAQGAFDLLDTDKNGQLSEDEWNRSRYAKKLFTEGKVELKFPLAKASFVETYKKLAP